MTDQFIVGIDTSNYTTSLAACDMEGNVFFDKRILLHVKKGEKGLRQSDAFFQHIQNLPGLVTALRAVTHGRFPAAVAVSDRPRPLDGSYMPVFTAGVNMGAVIALTAESPLYSFSHQEGHIEAAQYGLGLRPGRMRAPNEPNEATHISGQLPERFLAFHLSGGTTELLKAERRAVGYQVDIIGGSRDLSAGQLIDRVGVALGLPFPCGRALDELALARRKAAPEPVKIRLADIHVEGTWMNLSGIETQCRRLMESGIEKEESVRGAMAADIALLVFTKLKAALEAIIRRAQKETGIEEVLLVGGVSESNFLSLHETYRLCPPQAGSRTDSLRAPSQGGHYGTDNAVGTALLGLGRFLS